MAIPTVEGAVLNQTDRWGCRILKPNQIFITNLEAKNAHHSTNENTSSVENTKNVSLVNIPLLKHVQ